jgi:glycosyltransferase involved in cell wall biosynthesis
MNIVVVANTAWYIENFRGRLISVLLKRGHKVLALGAFDGHEGKLRSLGAEVENVQFDGGTNPLPQLRSISQLRNALRRFDPDVVLSYTPKGNIYTALSLGSNRQVTQIANVSGLGRAFVSDNFLTLLVSWMYRYALRRAAWVFFQNREDMAIFASKGLVKVDCYERIPGSGVDIQKFRPPLCSDRVPDRQRTRFLMVARMLWDKGVGEFVEAARLVRARHPDTQFDLLGPIGVDNPSAVSRPQMEAWVQEGVINYLGVTDDTRPHLASSDCVVLPSFYREGVPRSLLEAAAMGLPLIAADSIGCRDAVDDGVTGLLCKPRSSVDLAEKMERMLKVGVDGRAAMGSAGRLKMEREFSEDIVIDRYLAAIDRYTATP